MKKILDFKLCNSAYRFKTYFFKNDTGISKFWSSQGYKIKNIDIENQKMVFTKFEHKRKKVIIPKFLYRNDLSPEIIEEKIVFLHL